MPARAAALSISGTGHCRLAAAAAMNANRLGVLLVVASAMIMSTKGVFAKLLYSEGVSVTALVTVRALVALPIFWAYGLWRAGRTRLLHIDRLALGWAAAAGFACYYVGALVDFHALTLIPVGLERVLLYSYPALVILVRSIEDRRWPARRVLLALLLTSLGVLFAVGGFDAALWRANAYGAGLVMISAATFAFFFIANERTSARAGSIEFTVYAMTAAAAALVAHCLVTGATAELALSGDAWRLMALMVVLVMVLPLFMLSEGVRLIGAQRAALVSTVGPPAATLAGVLVLGEALAATQLVGAALVVLGIVTLETRRRPASRPASTPAASD